MPKVKCDAVTCRYNSGNRQYIKSGYKSLGVFECEAETIELKNRQECPKCGDALDITDCLAYRRRLGDEDERG